MFTNIKGTTIMAADKEVMLTVSREESIEVKAKKFAIQAHQNVNHFYGSVPYSTHLEDVVNFAKSFMTVIPGLIKEEDKEDVLAACWCHDVIEDTRKTYNDVKKETNERVAEIVFALTNEKGKTRKERANDKYYEGIKKTQYATFVKLCDRAANMKHSEDTGSSMSEMYKKELSDFIGKLYDKQYDTVFAYLKGDVKFKEEVSLKLVDVSVEKEVYKEVLETVGEPGRQGSEG